MASDIHCHPCDLLELFPNAEEERRQLGVACLASAWNKEQFLLHESWSEAARNDKKAPLYLGFAVHPQLPAQLFFLKSLTQRHRGHRGIKDTNVPSYLNSFINSEGTANDYKEHLNLLATLAAEGCLNAVGETGFDLYSTEYKETENAQDELFAAHLEAARRYDLPLILHVRRAMHKIFPHTKALKALKAVVFHSWPGSPDEGASLLRRGVPAFFSFGAALLCNHKNAIRSCAAFPLERLLLETDAPYQALPALLSNAKNTAIDGNPYSTWADLKTIREAAAAIRKEAGVSGGNAQELEVIVDRNFSSVLV